MKNLSYQELYSSRANQLELRDALDLHYQFNPQFTRWHMYKSDEAKDLVKAHDISHVIFGCDTGLLGEMQVQIWSKFAIEPMSLKDKIRYARNKESRVLLHNPIGFPRMVAFFVRNFSEVKRIKARCAGMSKKWTYFEADDYMSVTVGQIRASFGIVL